MCDKIRLALTGLGGIAQIAHLDAYSALRDRCEIVAGCDIDKQKHAITKEKYGIDKYYTDFKTMIDTEKLDAVLIATPNNTHMEMSMYALQKNVSVLCEKPVCVNASEAEKLKKIIDASSAKFMIGQCFRFRNQTKLIQQLIQSNKLGEIYYCKASYLRQRGVPGFGTWFTDQSRAHGGVVLDLGVHLLDYIWFLLGKPNFKSVSATTYNGISKRFVNGEKAGFKTIDYPPTYTGPEHNIFDVDEMGTTFIRFENGVVFHMEVAWAMNICKNISDGVIFGNKGSVSLSPVIFTHDENDKMRMDEIPVENCPSHNNQAIAFLDFLEGKIDNPAPIEDGLVIMKVIDAIYQSAYKRKEINL